MFEEERPVPGDVEVGYCVVVVGEDYGDREGLLGGWGGGGWWDGDAESRVCVCGEGGRGDRHCARDVRCALIAELESVPSAMLCLED